MALWWSFSAWCFIVMSIAVIVNSLCSNDASFCFQRYASSSSTPSSLPKNSSSVIASRFLCSFSCPNWSFPRGCHAYILHYGWLWCCSLSSFFSPLSSFCFLFSSVFSLLSSLFSLVIFVQCRSMACLYTFFWAWRYMWFQGWTIVQEAFVTAPRAHDYIAARPGFTFHIPRW